MQEEVRSIIFVSLFIIILFILSTVSELPQIPSNKADTLDTNLFSELNKEFEKYFSILGYAAAQLAPTAIDDITPKETPITDTCTPEWSCSEWSGCKDNIQTRNCIDINNCGTFENKPNTESFCGEVEIKQEEPKLGQSLTLDIFPYTRSSQFSFENQLLASPLFDQRFDLITDPRGIILSENALESNQDGWIIRLKNKEPAAVLKEATLEDILQQKREIQQEQDRIINEISAIDPKVKVRNKFDTVYSGFSAKIDDNKIEQIRNIPGVKGVFPNLQVQATLYESVPLINADNVWRLNKFGNPCRTTEVTIIGAAIQTPSGGPIGGECITGKGVTIGIIDTGVDYTHEDLGGCFGEGCKVIDGYDFVNDDNDPMDDAGHGTHVAATAAGDGIASDRTVLKGVAPDSSIVAYKVLNQNGYGYFDDVIAAIERSVDPNRDGDFSDHLDIISLSLGADCNYDYNENCGPDDPMSMSIDNAVGIGIVAAIAAGNSYHFYWHMSLGVGSIGSPGTARKAITVAASDKTDAMAQFSSGGPVVGNNFGLVKPDVTAPGVSICAAQYDDWLSYLRCLDNKHIAISGTSMATPHVSGTVALILQAHPDWTPLEIKMALRNHGIDLGERILVQGYGRIDARGAVFSEKPPIAQLDSGGEVNGSINVLGTASGTEFESYSLYYESGLYPSTWTLLTTSTTRVENGVLFSGFDVRTLSDGFYTFRLLVRNSAGPKSEDRSIILLDNIKISGISRFQEFSNNFILQIRGSTDVSDFGSYRLEVSAGNFNQDGLTFSNPLVLRESNVPVVNGTLGEWDLRGINQDQYYKITLTVFDRGDRLLGTEERIVYIENENLLHQGWPVSIQGFYTESSFNPYNVDQTIELELFFSNQWFDQPYDMVPNFYGFKHDAQVLTGWPVHFDLTGNSEVTPAIGDLDNDGNPEIASVSFGELFVFNSMGERVFSYNPPLSGGGEFSPTIADLNNDGLLEIIFFAYGRDYQSSVLSVVNAQGNSFGNYPIALPGRVLGQAVGDVNGDQFLDIVFFENLFESEVVRLIVLSGQNGQITVERELRARSVTAPILADLDNDGDLEIIAAIRHDLYGNGAVYVFNSDGSFHNGWPQIVTTNGVTADGFPEIPSVGDIDQDGDLEIFFANWLGWIYGWSHTGQILAGWPFEGYPRRLGNTGFDYYGSLYIFTQPVIANIDDDPDMEIIVQSRYLNNNLILALNKDTSMVDWFPKQLIPESHSFYSSTLAIADIDNDGQVELVSHSQENIPSRGWSDYQHIVIKVWDLPQTQGITVLEWPMFQHDPQHTGNYEFSAPNETRNKTIHTDIPVETECPPNRNCITLIFTPHPTDGSIEKSDRSWDISHDATRGSLLSNRNRDNQVGSLYDSYTGYNIKRTFFAFNTSSIPDRAGIISAKFQFTTSSSRNYDYDNDGNDFITLVHSTQANPQSLTFEDYDQCGPINNPPEGANRLDVTSLLPNSVYEFNLNNNGKSWINNQGWTTLGIREGHDVLDQPPDGLVIVAINASESTTPPKLVVTYAS